MGLSCHNSGAERWRAIAPVMAAIMIAAATALSPESAAMSPFPFFQRVDHVGLICFVDPKPDQAAAVEETTLCDLAVAELRELIGGGGPTVAAFGRNDERIADQATLLVLLHATLRASAPAESDSPTGTVLALSAELRRARTDVGAPPFFAASPQAVVAPTGSPDVAALRAALRRLLTGVARPLSANR